MNNVQIEESPGKSTSGITSATQLVNVTDAAVFDVTNTSSAIPEETVIALEPSPSKSPDTTQKSLNFKEALHQTVREQSDILDILATL